MNTTPEQLPVVGSTCTVSGANNDISETSRGFTTAKVLAYTDDGLFACFQKEGCWPFVHRLDNCSFTPRPGDEVDGKKVPEPWSLTRHIPGFRPLRDDESWHRTDWTEEMLEGGWRPLLKGEEPQSGCEYKSGYNPADTFTPDSGGASGGAETYPGWFRTRRPLPEPPKLVPLGPSDWLKDGPWWIKYLREPNEWFLVTSVTDREVHFGIDHGLTHEDATGLKRTNDGINWQACSKTA